jgi:hypothetical protein
MLIQNHALMEFADVVSALGVHMRVAQLPNGVTMRIVYESPVVKSKALAGLAADVLFHERSSKKKKSGSRDEGDPLSKLGGHQDQADPSLPCPALPDRAAPYLTLPCLGRTGMLKPRVIRVKIRPRFAQTVRRRTNPLDTNVVTVIVYLSRRHDMTKKSKAPEYVSSMVRLTVEVAAILKKNAEANHRSFAAEVRMAAEQWAAGLQAKS